MAAVVGLAGCALFGALELTAWRPGAPDPPLLSEGPGRALRLTLALVGAIALAVSVRCPRIGGTIAAVVAMGLGGLVAFEAHPAMPVLVGGATLGAALVGAVGGWRGRRARLIASAAVAAAAAGAVALTWWGYHFLYGATHPASSAAGPPRGAVEWVWSGGVTRTTAVVTAKLRDADRAPSLSVDPVATVTTQRDGPYVRFALDGLPAGRLVRYRVIVEGAEDRSGEGSFQTMPGGAASFTVAVSSCARTGSNGAVFDAIRAERPLVFLHLGDMFYANIEDDDPERFRRAYDRALTRPAQANLARSTATSYVWDDHDFGPNDADSTAPSAPAAHAVYRALVPHHRLALAGPRAPLGQAFTIGRVRFVVTDTRSARSPSDTPDGPGKSMLGAAQREWFERELLAARDRDAAIVWVNPVPWIGAPSPGADGWAGYAHERRELADFIAANGIERLVMLSGDTHAVAIDNGTNAGYATGGGGGFPVMHAGALDRAPQIKGGPYSEGVFPGGGRFGTLTVRDDGGGTIALTLRGLTWERRELTALRVVFRVPSGSANQ